MWHYLILLALAQAPDSPVQAELKVAPAPFRYHVDLGIVGGETGARVRRVLMGAQVGVRYKLEESGGVGLTWFGERGSEGTPVVGAVTARHRLQFGVYWERGFRFGRLSAELGVHPTLASHRLYGPDYEPAPVWSVGFGGGAIFRGMMPAGGVDLGFSLALLQRNNNLDVWMGTGVEF